MKNFGYHFLRRGCKSRQTEHVSNVVWGIPKSLKIEMDVGSEGSYKLIGSVKYVVVRVFTSGEHGRAFNARVNEPLRGRSINNAIYRDPLTKTKRRTKVHKNGETH